MASEYSIRRYRNWYAKLIRLYPKPYRERFGEGMAQTFNDLCRERQDAGEGLFTLALWVFVETSARIIRGGVVMVITQNKRIVGMTLAVAFILLIPLLAMQFTDEVVWNLGDFAVAGALLVGTGLTYELIARRSSKIVYRAAVGVAVVTALLLVWVNGAVGIIGDGGNPSTLMYFGVLAVGIIAAIAARLEPRGMARALFATALAQALVPMIALIIWNPQVNSWGAAGVLGVFGLNAFFVMLFVVSALLFRRARPRA